MATKTTSCIQQISGRYNFLGLAKGINTSLSNQILHATDATPGKAVGRPTGVPTIDYRVNGALPAGKCHYFYGPEMSGKTTMALHLIKEAQNDNVPVIYIDAEHAADPTYLMSLGIDAGRTDFVCSQPYTGEDAFRLLIGILEAIRQSDTVFSPATGPLIIIDTLKALVPELNLADKNPTALLARLLSNWLNQVKMLSSITCSTLVLINQVRTNPMQMFGNPETEPGGMAVRHIPDTKYRMSKVGKNENYVDGSVGHATRCSLKKAKHCAPCKTDDIWIKLGQGFDVYHDLINYFEISGFATKVTAQSFEFNRDLFAKWLPHYKMPSKNKIKSADLLEMLRASKDSEFDFYQEFKKMGRESNFYGDLSPEALRLRAAADKRDELLFAASQLSPSTLDLPSMQEGVDMLREEDGSERMEKVLKYAGIGQDGIFDDSIRPPIFGMPSSNREDYSDDEDMETSDTRSHIGVTDIMNRDEE